MMEPTPEARFRDRVCYDLGRLCTSAAAGYVRPILARAEAAGALPSASDEQII